MTLHKSRLYLLLIIILLFLSPLNSSQFHSLRIIGSTSLISLFLLAIIVTLYKIIFKNECYFSKSFFILISILLLLTPVYTLSSFDSISLFKNNIYIISIMLFNFFLIVFSFMLGANIDYFKYLISKIPFFFYMIILSIIFIKITDDNQQNYSYIFSNSNTLGLFMVPYSLIAFQGIKNKITSLLMILLCVLIIYWSGSRASLLALLMGVSIIIICRNISKGLALWISVLFSIAIPIIFIFININHDNSIILQLNTYTQELTNKNLLSGRHIIWSEIFEAIQQRPILGFGPSATPNDVVGIPLSSHNFFLQITLQLGFMGLGVFFLFIIYMFKLIWSTRASDYFPLTLALWSSLLIIQSFEVTLFQNNVALSIPFIAIIILTIGYYSSTKESH